MYLDDLTIHTLRQICRTHANRYKIPFSKLKLIGLDPFCIWKDPYLVKKMLVKFIIDLHFNQVNKGMGKRLPNNSIYFEVRISIDNEHANTCIMMEIFFGVDC